MNKSYLISWHPGRGFGAYPSIPALSKTITLAKPSRSTGRRTIWELSLHALLGHATFSTCQHLLKSTIRSIARHHVSSKAPSLELLWVVPNGSEEAEIERRPQWQGSRRYEWNSQLRLTHTIRKSFPARTTPDCERPAELQSPRRPTDWDRCA